MKILAVVCLVLTSFAMSGCSDTINGKSLAEPKVEQFYNERANMDYKSSYAAASEEFKKAVSQEKWGQLLGAVSRKLGRHKSHTLINWNSNTFNMTTRTVLVYQSKYEEGEATETFSYLVSDGQVTLLSYNINSFDMLVK